MQLLSTLFIFRIQINAVQKDLTTTVKAAQLVI